MRALNPGDQHASGILQTDLNRLSQARREELFGIDVMFCASMRSPQSCTSMPESDIGSGNSMLADTVMVSPADGDANRFSPSSSGSTPVPGGHTFSQLRLPSCGWRVSGDSSEQKRFQKVSTLSSHHGERRPHTTQLGVNGRDGAPHTIPIPFRQILPTSLNF